jgi:hypothetical protein
MSKSLQLANSAALQKLEKLLIHGDLKSLNDEERLQHVGHICKIMKINPLLKPFDYISFQGKTVLYANRSATDQLRAIHNISIYITKRETIDGVHIVTARAKTGKGKEDESTGAINIKGKSGEELANAYMKAETKAKRRVTLSITGLGILDEIEVQEMVERDVKKSADQKVEQIERKIEVDSPAPIIEPEDLGYRIKSGINKGKRISKISEKKLREWLKFYDDQKARGVAFDPEVDDDAFHIRAHLDDPSLKI